MSKWTMNRRPSGIVLGVEPDRSWGRYPNATGDFDVLQPTPGESNGGGGPAPDVFTRGDANDDGKCAKDGPQHALQVRAWTAGKETLSQ